MKAWNQDENVGFVANISYAKHCKQNPSNMKMQCMQTDDHHTLWPSNSQFTGIEKKVNYLYWLPTSGPCPKTSRGSWLAQNTSKSCLYWIIRGSYSTWTVEVQAEVKASHGSSEITQALISTPELVHFYNGQKRSKITRTKTKTCPISSKEHTPNSFKHTPHQQIKHVK